MNETSGSLVKTTGHPAITYPSNHQVGMEVPVGGSNCAKCRFVDGQNCKNKAFVRWNRGPVIPKKIDRYCCDMFTEGSADNSRMAKAFKGEKYE